MELFHVRGDGTKVAVEVRTKRIQEHGRPALVTAVRDITAHKKLRAKLKRLAVTDPLTGVNNRRRLMKSGRRERERSLRHGHPLSVMMIDVDHFKRINDRFGHDNGDTALRELARIATKLLRSSDVFARLGGEEFAALLPETDADGALTLAQRLRARVEECSIETDLGPLRFTISIGVSTFEDDDRSIKVPLGRADKALYAAKRAGRNRVRRA
jgi:diguanylate cyclase (GGDEF)-like protein